MSVTMVRLCMETLRGVLAWGLRADVRKLPPDFVQPITKEILGPKSCKDPLRACPLPLHLRTEILRQMDEWQLLNLTTLLILPTRFEDVSGAVISDFDLERRVWHLGDRFGGNDFNKGRVNVQMPLPEELIPLLERCIGGRPEGPMFLQRKAFTRTARRSPTFESSEELNTRCQERLRTATAREVETAQGRKAVVRKLLADHGAISTNVIGKELSTLFLKVGVPSGTRPYDLRGAVTREMKEARVDLLERRYLTLHTAGDVMTGYEGLTPHGEMMKYFDRIRPLLAALAEQLVRFSVNE